MNPHLLVNLIIFSLAQATVATTLVYLFCINPVVVAWERRQWARFKRFLRRQLRKSKRIVAWAESDNTETFDDMCLANAEIWSNWYTA